MKRLLRFGVLLLAAWLILGIAGCDNGTNNDNQQPGGTDVDYTNYITNFSIKVKNDANKKLVAFKGAPSTSTLIGGIPIGGGEHGLKKGNYSVQHPRYKTIEM